MFSFFSNKALKDSEKVKKVLFLDFDGTVALPKRNENGDYDMQLDGFIEAKLIDPDRFDILVTLAIVLDIPLYFVTGRTDISRNKELLERITKRVTYYYGHGGFRDDAVHFISKRILVGHEWEDVAVKTKADVIQDIHHTKYPYLDPHDILFVDDVEKFIEPVRKLGYQTLLANPDNEKHFEFIERFLIGDALTLTV